MSETQVEAKAPKKVTTYESVQMEDGRKVEFAGTRQVDKTVLEDAAGVATGIRYDFRNGATRTLTMTELGSEMLARCAVHGAGQKSGDEYSGVKEIDDMVLAVEEIFARLRAGDWGAVREAGDSTAGASIVIKALVEQTGKPIEKIKLFLQGKLDKAKAAGTKLSRKELYDSFRVPGTPTYAIIKRLEEEKLAKSTKVSAADKLAEMDAE